MLYAVVRFLTAFFVVVLLLLLSFLLCCSVYFEEFVVFDLLAPQIFCRCFALHRSVPDFRVTARLDCDECFSVLSVGGLVLGVARIFYSRLYV